MPDHWTGLQQHLMSQSPALKRQQCNKTREVSLLVAGLGVNLLGRLQACICVDRPTRLITGLPYSSIQCASHLHLCSNLCSNMLGL
jgi:hypothetical protein